MCVVTNETFISSYIIRQVDTFQGIKYLSEMKIKYLLPGIFEVITLYVKSCTIGKFTVPHLFLDFFPSTDCALISLKGGIVLKTAPLKSNTFTSGLFYMCPDNFDPYLEA